MGDGGFSLPGDRSQYLPDRNVQVSHIKISCRFNIERREVIGEVSLSFKAVTNEVRRVILDCADSEVSSVRMGDTDLGFSLAEDRLEVVLSSPLLAGESATLDIAYVSRPQVGLYFTAPDEDYPDKPVQIWTQGQDTDNHHWFPCIDEPRGLLTSEIICTVQEGWTVISNGRLLNDSSSSVGGERTYHWLQDKPHAVYLITLVAGEFSRVVLQDSDPLVDFYCQPGREEDARRAFENTAAMISFFEERTGEPYPWDKYSQVAVQDFIFGGMENTSATTQTDLTLHDAKAHKDFSSDFLVAHEAAHQWFGDLITCREWPHGWLNEGFATFFEALWTEHFKGDDEYLQELISMEGFYLSESYRRPIVYRRYSNHVDIFDRHLYEKAGLVLHVLRRELGDELFFGAVRRYVQDNKGRNVITSDFQRSVEDATGRSLDWFFDQWVYRSGHPHFEITYSWEPDKSPDDPANTEANGSGGSDSAAGNDNGATNGKAVLSINQTQSDPFRCTVDIVVGTSDGHKTFRETLKETRSTVSIPLPARPQWIHFDGSRAVIKTQKFKRPVSMLINQLRDGHNASARIEAAELLGKESSPEALEALETAMKEDPFWAVQAKAARALGEMRTKSARDALIASKSLEHLKARRALASALGRFRYDEAAASALTEMLNSEDSYYVSATAAMSLGSVRGKDAFSTLSKATRRDSHLDVIRSGALSGLAELGGRRAEKVLLKWTRRGLSQRARIAATGGLAKFDPDKRRIVERLTDLLEDDWFQVKIAASHALGSFGVRQAVAHLRKLAEKDKNGRVARTALRVASSIDKGKTTSDEVKKLREQLEEVKAEVNSLRSRTSKLEISDK